MATKTQDIVDVRDTILEYLEGEERSLAWLARGTKINYNTMHSIFKHKIVTLSPDKLGKINAFLGKNFRL